MSIDWGALCEAAQARPLWEQLRDVYAWGGVLVRARSLPHKAASKCKQMHSRVYALPRESPPCPATPRSFSRILMHAVAGRSLCRVRRGAGCSVCAMAPAAHWHCRHATAAAARLAGTRMVHGNVVPGLCCRRFGASSANRQRALHILLEEAEFVVDRGAFTVRYRDVCKTEIRCNFTPCSRRR
jgi:hypothetical protein